MTTTETPDIATLVELYTADLFKRACYKVSDVEMAKDLVQETFMAAAEKIANFKGQSAPKTWLFAILNNKIIDYYRSKVAKPYHHSQSLSGFFSKDGDWLPDKRPGNWGQEEGHLLDNTEFKEILKACLDALPEKWNLGIKLKFLMEKESEEICQELGITQTNFWQIIHRAKLQLRQCIENKWYIEN